MRASGDDEVDALVTALKRGVASAGPVLVSVVAPSLVGYARRIAPDLGQADHEEACDAALDKAVRKIDLYDRSKGRFAAWIRPFVRHELAEIRRKRGHTVPLEAAESRLVDLSISPESGSDALTSLDLALLRLSPQDQLIISLYDFDRLSYEECAQLIGGVSAGACKVRRHRALQRLKKLLQEELGNDEKGGHA